MSKQYAFGNQPIDKLLNEAVAAYSDGRPVVVRDENGSLLHGEEFLKGIVALGQSMPDFRMGAIVFHGVSRKYFESTDWPEILEAARQVFFLKEIA